MKIISIGKKQNSIFNKKTKQKIKEKKRIDELKEWHRNKEKKRQKWKLSSVTWKKTSERKRRKEKKKILNEELTKRIKDWKK